MLNTAQAHRSGIKTKKGERYENQHEIVWAKYVSLAQKNQNSRHFMPKRQRIKIFLTGVKLNWPRLNSF